MYFFLISFLIAMSTSVLSAGRTYSEAELLEKSHDELVDIVLKLQGASGEGADCTILDPISGDKPSLLGIVLNRGYTNHGTLKWPNGSIFMLRNSGYTNDRTFYYPNGKVMQLKNSGYQNDLMSYWPNGKTMALANKGYTNHGTIYRNDGSVWLLRNSGYRNDRTRTGLPIDRYSEDGFTVRARLTSEDGVAAKTIVNGDGWKIEILYNSEDNSIKVKECFLD